MSNFLSIKSASDLLGVSTKTLRRWEKEGKIASTRRRKAREAVKSAK